MRTVDVARLLALAAIWSASFVFVRMLAPVIGPAWTAAGRLAIGGVAVAAWVTLRRTPVGLAAHWRGYLLMGLVNCAIPFLLFGYAALHLPASYLVILNATTPLFAACMAAVVLDDGMSLRKALGLCAALAGVALVTRAVPLPGDGTFAWAVAAGLAASACYALAAVWQKRRGGTLVPIGIAAFSQLAGALLLLPVAARSTAAGALDAHGVAALGALGLLCSGVAYLLYYRLVRDIGPTRATTVTFLMPAFGMLWGAWFLDETVTAGMIAGAAVIVAGTLAVLRPPRPAAART